MKVRENGFYMGVIFLVRDDGGGRVFVWGGVRRGRNVLVFITYRGSKEEKNGRKIICGVWRYFYI